MIAACVSYSVVTSSPVGPCGLWRECLQLCLGAPVSARNCSVIWIAGLGLSTRVLLLLTTSNLTPSLSTILCFLDHHTASKILWCLRSGICVISILALCRDWRLRPCPVVVDSIRERKNTISIILVDQDETSPSQSTYIVYNELNHILCGSEAEESSSTMPKSGMMISRSIRIPEFFFFPFHATAISTTSRTDNLVPFVVSWASCLRDCFTQADALKELKFVGSMEAHPWKSFPHWRIEARKKCDSCAPRLSRIPTLFGALAVKRVDVFTQATCLS